MRKSLIGHLEIRRDLARRGAQLAQIDQFGPIKRDPACFPRSVSSSVDRIALFGLLANARRRCGARWRLEFEEGAQASDERCRVFAFTRGLFLCAAGFLENPFGFHFAPGE